MKLTAIKIERSRRYWMNQERSPARRPHPKAPFTLYRIAIVATQLSYQNSLIKGLFFGRFSLNMGGFSRNWRKIAKNGWLPAKHSS